MAISVVADLKDWTESYTSCLLQTVRITDFPELIHLYCRYQIKGLKSTKLVDLFHIKLHLEKNNTFWTKVTYRV